jgi:hypothetical protein
LEPAQGAHLIALEGMCARSAVLDPADVEIGTVEVYLVPTEVAQLRCPQSVPERHQDRGRVSMPVPPLLGGLDEDLDLLWREMFAGAKFGVWTPTETNSSIK